jgi:hypothetical protein
MRATEGKENLEKVAGRGLTGYHLDLTRFSISIEIRRIKKKVREGKKRGTKKKRNTLLDVDPRGANAW